MSRPKPAIKIGRGLTFERAQARMKEAEGGVPLRFLDMDICGDLFGLKLLDDCVQLFIEDDELWYLTATFDRAWLPDLKAVIDRSLTDS